MANQNRSDCNSREELESIDLKSTKTTVVSNKTNSQYQTGCKQTTSVVILISGAGTPTGTGLALSFAGLPNYKLALLDSDKVGLNKVSAMCKEKYKLHGKELDLNKGHDWEDAREEVEQQPSPSSPLSGIDDVAVGKHESFLELLIDLADPVEGQRRAADAISRTVDFFGRLDIVINLGLSVCPLSAELAARHKGKPETNYSEKVDKQGGDEKHESGEQQQLETKAETGSRMNCVFDNCVTNYHKIMNSQVNASVYLSLASFEALKSTSGSIVNITNYVEAKSNATPTSGVCAGTRFAQSKANVLPNANVNVNFNSNANADTNSNSNINTNNSHSDGMRAQYTFDQCMAKAALTTFSKCLAHDFAPHVRVNCISLGPIASGIIDDMGLTCVGSRTQAKQTTTDDRNNNDHSNRNNNDRNICPPEGKKLGAFNSKSSSCSSSCVDTAGSDAGMALKPTASALRKTTPPLMSTFTTRTQTTQTAMMRRENELAKMIIYLSSRESGSSITGSRVLLGSPEYGI